jgi:predicted RNase H-like nuclease
VDFFSKNLLCFRQIHSSSLLIQNKKKEESFRFKNNFIRDVLIVEAAIIKQNNLKKQKKNVFYERR